MDLNEAITGRRAVREYAAEPVDESSRTGATEADGLRDVGELSSFRTFRRKIARGILRSVNVLATGQSIEPRAAA